MREGPRRCTDLSYATFNNADLDGSNFEGASLALATFGSEPGASGQIMYDNMNFKRANLLRTTFRNILFSDTDFSGADFSQSTFDNVSFKIGNAKQFNNTFNRTRFGVVDLSSTDLTIDDLHDAILCNVTLNGVVLLPNDCDLYYKLPPVTE